MLKQTLIATAALALTAVPAFAFNGVNTGNVGSFNTHTSTKTVTVTKAEVTNHAHVDTTSVSVANTGLNFSSANGGKTSSDTSAKTGSADSGNAQTGSSNGVLTSSGDASNGGNTSGDAHAGSFTAGGDTKSVVVTGDAGSSSSVTNVVNTTVVKQ